MKIHGHTANQGRWVSPTYKSWKSMMNRCYDPSHVSFDWYGGRGVGVYERWHTFLNFLADNGERPSKAHSLSRINDKGNYEPGNVTWKIQNNGFPMRRKAYEAMGPAERRWFEMKRARGAGAPKDDEFVCEEVVESINEVNDGQNNS
jgi:hypothetical protein